MDLDYEDIEPTALEYARLHGLCIAYDSEQPDISSLRTYINEEVDQDSSEPSLQSITNAIGELSKERLAITKDAALLLRSIHDLQNATPTTVPLFDARQIQGLKQELPILRTDHELDLQSFGDAALPDLRNLRIPTEIVNEENDEGLQWPAKYSEYPRTCSDRIKAEKLSVSRDVLLYLQEAIRDDYKLSDLDATEVKDMNYKPNTRTRPVTPPLLPLSPPLTPYVPSSPANRLCLASESSNSVIVEAKALEQQIMAADCLTRNGSDSNDSMLLDFIESLDTDEAASNQPVAILKRRASDLKVEGPLTPPILSDSPMKKLKSVSFTDLNEIIPNALWAGSHDEDQVTDYGSSNGCDEIFNNEESLREQVNKLVHEEKLTTADTVARVEVPHVDFVMPVAPWNEYSQRKGSKRRSCDTELEAQMQFILRVKLDDLRSAAPWHGLSSVERELRWSIFTSKISKISLDEKLHGEMEFEKVLADINSGQISTSSSQVWKREGLRILDEEEEEEKIEATEHDDRQDIEALIRKRKLELDEEATEQLAKRMSANPTSQIHTQSQARSHHGGPEQVAGGPEKLKMHDSTAKQKSKPQPPVHNELMFGGFSATSALHKFMETRGRTVKPANTTAEQPGAANHLFSQNLTLTVRSREPSIPDDILTCKTPPTVLPQLPAIPTNLPPCSFIISSKFLQRRSLMKQIETLYPAATIHYRDYALPHSPSYEADFILSPSTGLIETTLQQIKQRPLPGQPDRFPTKERMTALDKRYERLVVIVSEGLSREMVEHGSSRPDDARDKEVLAEYQNLASQLEGEVLIQYVPGGEEAVARLFVVEMAKYGLPHGSRDIGDIKLLAVETSWEVFLRRVGFNPYAAQVIVAWLKKPFEVQLPGIQDPGGTSAQPQNVTVFGLSAFLVLDEEERIKYFQALMGGSRILKRASRVLSKGWVSAAHGFRV